MQWYFLDVNWTFCSLPYHIIRAVVRLFKEEWSMPSCEWSLCLQWNLIFHVYDWLFWKCLLWNVWSLGKHDDGQVNLMRLFILSLLPCLFLHFDNFGYLFGVYMIHWINGINLHTFFLCLIRLVSDIWSSKHGLAYFERDVSGILSSTKVIVANPVS